MDTQLLDFVVLALYFAVMVGAGYWGLRREHAPTTTWSLDGDWALSCILAVWLPCWAAPRLSVGWLWVTTMASLGCGWSSGSGWAS